MIDLSSILGTEYYTIFTTALGEEKIIYNLHYIVVAILFLMTWKYVLTWLTILVKTVGGIGND